MATMLAVQQPHSHRFPLQSTMQDPVDGLRDRFGMHLGAPLPVQQGQGPLFPREQGPQGLGVQSAPGAVANPVQSVEGTPPPEELEPQGVPQEVIDRDCRILTFSEAMAEESERAFQADAGFSPGDGNSSEDADSADTVDVRDACVESANGDPESFLFTEDCDANCASSCKCPCAVKPKNMTVYIQGLQEDAEEEPSCEICQCGYEETDQVMVLPCHHFYHLDCITKWLGMKTTCPKCRFEVSPPPPQREVTITRTTTIEWMPVTLWVPASTTTVDVRSEVGSEFETVTTTTTRPAVVHIPGPPGAPHQLPPMPGPPPPPPRPHGHGPHQPPAAAPQLPPNQQQLMPPAPGQAMMAPAPGPQLFPGHPTMIPAPGQSQPMLEYAPAPAPGQQMLAPGPGQPMVDYAPAPTQPPMEYGTPQLMPPGGAGPMGSPRRVNHRRGHSGGGDGPLPLSSEDYQRMAPPPPPMRQTQPPAPSSSPPAPQGMPLPLPVFQRPPSGSWQAMMGSSGQQMFAPSPPVGPTSRMTASSLGPPSPTIQPTNAISGPPPPHTPPLMPGGPLPWAIPTMEAQANAVFAQGSQRFLQL